MFYTSLHVIYGTICFEDDTSTQIQGVTYTILYPEQRMKLNTKQATVFVLTLAVFTY